MKRARIFLLTELCILIILLIISIINDNENIVLIPFLAIICLNIFISIIEYKIINNKIKPYFIIDDYHSAAEYLNNQFIKCFIYRNVYFCLIALIISYMYLGKTTETKFLLEKYKRIKNNKNLLYMNMILLISENQLVEAKLLQTKLFKLNGEIFNVQKLISIKIFRMIEDKKFDESVYNSTKYPLIKSICLRYKSDEMKNTKENDKEPVSLTQFEQLLQLQKNKRSVKSFSIILNILTINIIYVALILVSIKSNSYDPITSTDGLYYFIKTIWILLLFLPISLGCMMFGLLLKKKGYKTTSNIVIGVIISISLLGFGSMHFSGMRQYSTNNDYLSNLGNTIIVDFPKDFTIVSQDWTIGEQTSTDNIYFKYVSVIRFNDNTEILSFENNINNSYWIDGFSGSTLKFIPMTFIIETKNYDKYLLYCYESNEYNSETSTSNYNYISIAYSEQTNALIIYEFTIK